MNDFHRKVWILRRKYFLTIKIRSLDLKWPQNDLVMTRKWLQISEKFAWWQNRDEGSKTTSCFKYTISISRSRSETHVWSKFLTPYLTPFDLTWPHKTLISSFNLSWLYDVIIGSIFDLEIGFESHVSHVVK